MRAASGLAEPTWCHGLLAARWRRWPASAFAFASALLFALAMVLGAHPFTETLDWVLHGEPNLNFLQASLSAGELPWWNPHVGLGRPYASDLQSAVFYPPTYLLFLGKVVGPTVFIGLHAFLLILGMHQLSRQLGGRGAFGLLAGCALLASMGFGGRLLVGHTFYFAGLCYLPMLLVAAIQLRLRPNRWRIGTLALLLALQFLTGHPQVFWNTVFGLGLFLTGLSLRSAPASAWRRLPRFVAGFAAALTIAGGITAVSWLPFLDLIAEGNRQAPTLASASFGHFDASDVVGIVTTPSNDSRSNWEGNFRLGFAWTVPGLLGLALLRSTVMRGLLCLGAGAFWFSFGEGSWLFRLCYEFLPGASSFRVPARINCLTVLALTAAAAVCLSWMWQRRRRGTLAILLGGLGLWVGLQVLELSGAYGRYASLYSRQSVVGFTHEFPVVNQLRELQSAAPVGVPLRVMVPRILVSPNLGMRDRWTHVDSYTALFLGRPWTYLHRVAGVAPSPFHNASLAKEFYRQPPFSTPNLSLDVTVDLESGNVLVNTNGVPRLWITHQPRLVKTANDALAAVTQRLDLPREGIIETALPFPTQPTGEATGSAKILHFGHSEIEVACQLSHPSVLVLNEAWFPGWHTVVAGQRVESQPVNYWMRGFALPAGEHTLKLKFRPRRMAVATALSLVSVGVVALLMWRGRRSGRTSPPQPLNSGGGL